MEEPDDPVYHHKDPGFHCSVAPPPIDILTSGTHYKHLVIYCCRRKVIIAEIKTVFYFNY